MSDDDGFDFSDFEEFEEFDGIDDDLHGPAPLDHLESAQVTQDLVDLELFEATFANDGYVGVSVLCQDCIEEHFYPWDLLRGNLRMLLESGEVPVHEPAYQPDPERYVPWEYARGYVDALNDAGVDRRRPLDACPQCRLAFTEPLGGANFCPRCGLALVPARLEAALADLDLDDDTIADVLRQIGFAGHDR